VIPDYAQAASLNMVRVVPVGACASCGERPAAEGFIMCHECREACGLTYQPHLFSEEDAS
jgi:hypothetical protein